MKICVIADTHVQSIGQLPSPVLEALRTADLIVHAGDFTEKKVFDELRSLGSVEAVCGNMDSSELMQALSPQRVFWAGGKRIGLTHGSGSPVGIAQRVRRIFDNVDIVIFGHSHKPEDCVIEGSILFNPGPARKSYGILTVDKEIKTEIIEI